jgi:hypothetical protein
MRRTSVFAVAVIALSSSVASAEIFNWTINQASSFARITVPDQNITYSGITANVRPRAFNASSASNAWTDSTGRLAPLAGSFMADYTTDGSGNTHLKFLSDNITVAQVFNAQPNPASWNGTSFTNTSTALAAFASRVYLNAFVIANTDIRLALADIDVSLTSNDIVLGGGTTIPANATTLGLDDVSIYVKGNTIFGITIPDVNTSTSVAPFANTAGGSVTSLGGLNRQLTLNINIPVSIPVDATTIVTASIAGRIVATATVPEASSMVMVAVGLVGVGIGVIKRRRAS